MKNLFSQFRGVVSRFKTGITAALVLLTLFSYSNAMDADRQSELKRHTHNTERLAKMNVWVRPKIAAQISDLEGHGARPVIDAQVWRSPAQQAALKRAGRSTVSYSFHTVTDRDKNGRLVPASLAADITDARYGWNSGSEFWLMNASAAEAHGLETGIRWGLSTSDRKKIDAAIAKRDFKAKVPLGWDVAHSQPQARYITLKEAQRGKRPPVKRG